MWRRGFPPAKMCESIGDNPNRRLSHAGIVAGGFARHPRPSSRRRQAVRSGYGVAVRHSQHGRRGQLLPANSNPALKLAEMRYDGHFGNLVSATAGGGLRTTDYEFDGVYRQLLTKVAISPG